MEILTDATEIIGRADSDVELSNQIAKDRANKSPGSPKGKHPDEASPAATRSRKQ
jgi:hypothetical protein